jgi:hypothetical protein
MATGTGKTLTQDASIKLSFPGSSPIANVTQNHTSQSPAAR